VSISKAPEITREKLLVSRAGSASNACSLNHKRQKTNHKQVPKKQTPNAKRGVCVCDLSFEFCLELVFCDLEFPEPGA
jgi:hypothetical protein